jgi:hypothetical protein
MILLALLAVGATETVARSSAPKDLIALAGYLVWVAT